MFTELLINLFLSATGALNVIPTLPNPPAVIASAPQQSASEPKK